MSKVGLLEKTLRLILVLFFLFFLCLPLAQILKQSVIVQGDFTFELVKEIYTSSKWATAFLNSLAYSIIVMVIATVLGFLLAFGINFTNLPIFLKRTTQQIIILPMLLPTITYGFVLLYSFGKQGLWSQVFGGELFTIYGRNGVVLGLVIYSLPVTFMLLNDGMKYVDRKFFVVSRLLQDGFWQGLSTTLIKPLKKVVMVALIQSFFMSFTDFGIPVAVGGQQLFITTLLYEYFMGSLPDFYRGAVIALSMLLPSIISFFVLKYLQKEKGHHDQHGITSLRNNYVRDGIFAVLLSLVSGLMLSFFLVMFIIPFVNSWPYEMGFTFEHIHTFIQEPTLILALKNSLLVAFFTALFGTIIAYLSAVFTARSQDNSPVLKFIDSVASVTNSVPGMVLGIAYLLIFSGTPLHNTYWILIIVNIIHYFSTPYQMSKSALQKMNPNWENIAKLMGDQWSDSLCRVIIPNSKRTIIEVFSYYFTNSMVTISSVIFLVSARTMLVTTKIKELQHFGRFTDIFILSIILLIVNLVARIITQQLIRRLKKS